MLTPASKPLATIDAGDLFAAHEAERYDMHSRHLNAQMVRVLKTIGYDVGFCRGAGAYLYDREDVRYLDLLSGFGVFAIGRNHPAIRESLKSVLDAELPNLVQMDVSPLAGLLAERLLAKVPYLQRAFFTVHFAQLFEARHSALAAQVDQKIPGDREQPGVEACRAVVLGAARQHAHPGLLEQVLGHVAIAGEEEQVAQQPVLILHNQAVQQLRIVPAKPLCDLCVFGARLLC